MSRVCTVHVCLFAFLSLFWALPFVIRKCLTGSKVKEPNTTQQKLRRKTKTCILTLSLSFSFFHPSFCVCWTQLTLCFLERLSLPSPYLTLFLFLSASFLFRTHSLFSFFLSCGLAFLRSTFQLCVCLGGIWKKLVCGCVCVREILNSLYVTLQSCVYVFILCLLDFVTVSNAHSFLQLWHTFGCWKWRGVCDTVCMCVLSWLQYIIIHIGHACAFL